MFTCTRLACPLTKITTILHITTRQPSSELLPEAEGSDTKAIVLFIIFLAKPKES